MSTNSQLSFGVTSTLITDGTITNADISATAAIATSKISGLATSATTDTTNAANISSGTLPAARMPALTGDITTTAGAVATTLATVNSNVGSFGSASAVPVITVNAKGLVTAVSTTTITIPSSSISVTGGDLTMSGNTGTAITNATLATVNSNIGTFNNVTVNAKGLVTAASNVSYLTSYTESSTLADVTGRGSSTTTAITLSGGTTTLGHATANTLTTGTATATFTISTKDNSSGSTGLLTIKGGAGIGTNISGGSVSIAGGAGGNAGTTGGGGYVNAIGGAGYGTGTGGSFVGRSGAGGATGASGVAYFESGVGGSTSGDSGIVYVRSGSTTSGNSGNVNISAGTANIGIGGNVNITGGDTNSATQGGNVTVAGGPASTSTSGTAGQLTLRGGISNSTTTSAIGGTVYLSGGSASTTNAITKTGGSVYIDGGGSGANGSITYGSVYIGNQANGTTYGTANVYIGKGSGTNVYIKPSTVSAGFLKIDANGLVSSDTNTYLTSYSESDTLATVTARGASTSTASTFSGGLSVTGLTVAKSGTDSVITFPAQTNDPAYIKHYESNNTAIMYFNASDDTNDYFHFGYTGNPSTFQLRTDGVVTAGTWQASSISTSYTDAKVTSVNAGAGISVNQTTGAVTVTNTITNLNQLTNGPGYITGESDTLATVTARGATTSSTVSFTGASKLGIQGANDGSSNYGIFLWQTTDTNWGIYMSTSGSSKSLASGTAPASIDGRTSHHVRFRAGTGSTNGFIWETAQNETTIMSLASDTGSLYVKGSYYVGGSTSTYVTRNSTTGCMEFYV